jgi:hypothetical protein
VDNYTAELVAGIDYPLLLIFAGQFIQIEGIVTTGVPKCLWNSMFGWGAEHLPLESIGAAYALALAVLVLGNCISNVPLIILMRPMLDQVQSVDESRAVASAATWDFGCLFCLGGCPLGCLPDREFPRSIRALWSCVMLTPAVHQRGSLPVGRVCGLHLWELCDDCVSCQPHHGRERRGAVPAAAGRSDH